MSLEHEFLLADAARRSWSDTDPAAIMRRLCEIGAYAPSTNDNPELGREFSLVVYGWVWGRSGDTVQASDSSGILIYELDKVYDQVAAEQGWE